MLDEYEIEQPIVCKILKNAINNNKCSHAYLFETYGYEKQEELSIAFAKMLLCPYNYSNNNKCVNCTQCENISKNIFGELKIIKPDGMWIKKEQIMELQNEFKTKGILSNKKVYIITDVTKLNVSSSNSMLKFLEEPNDNIVAILLADNIHKLLDTIVSRCQIIPFKKIFDNNKIEYLLSSKVENIDELKIKVINFVNNLEKNKEKAIIDTKKSFINNFIEKDEIIVAFEMMILYYKDIINMKLKRNLDFFDDEYMRDIANDNTFDKLNKNIKIINSLKNKIYVNANTNLLIDKLILDLGGKNEYSGY